MNSKDSDSGDNEEVIRQRQKRPLELNDHQDQLDSVARTGIGGDDDDGGAVAGKNKRNPADPPPVELEDEASRSKKNRSKVMNNSLVMAKIAEKLPAGHLLNLRQTGSIWNHNFIPQLKGKHQPICPNWFPKHKNQDLDAQMRIQSIRDFTNLAGESHDFPFTRYSYQSFWSEDCEEENVAFQDFVTRFGNSITSLDLQNQNGLRSNELRSIIFGLANTLVELKINYPALTLEVETQSSGLSNRPMRTLSKLKRLEAGGPTMENAWDRAFTFLACDIVYCTTELEWLKVSGVGDDHQSFLSPILTVLLETFGNNLGKLRTLKLPSLLASDIRKLLQLSRRDHSSLQLEELSLSTNFNGIEPLAEAADGLLHEFLATQSPTLKTLFLNFCSFSDVHVHWRVFHIPPMEHLNFMHIGHRGRTPPKIRFRRPAQSQFIRFEDALPAIRKFTYKSGSKLSGNLTRLKQFYHSRVEEFNLQLVTYNFVRFARLHSMFGGLTRLKLDFSSLQHLHQAIGEQEVDIHIDGKIFANIWRTWPNLTSVHLTWKFNGLDLDLDAFLTGVPRLGLEQLRLELGSIDIDFESTKLATVTPTLVTLQKKLDAHKIRGGISDLRHLQEMTIIIDGERKPKLTDMGGYFGLALASPHLQRAVIHGMGENLLSAQCSQFIKRVFGPAAVIDL